MALIGPVLSDPILSSGWCSQLTSSIWVSLTNRSESSTVEVVVASAVDIGPVVVSDDVDSPDVVSEVTVDAVAVVDSAIEVSGDVNVVD